MVWLYYLCHIILRKMTYLDKKIQIRIDKKLQELNKLRPIQSSLVNKLHEQLALEMTYNSNAIEG